MDEIHAEDKKVLELILDYLLNELKHISKFSSKFSETYEEMFEYENDSDESTKYVVKGAVRTYGLDYNSGDKQKKQGVSLRFIPVFGTVSITTSECYRNREINIGWGPANKEIKIKFMKLWRTVNQWEEMEIPRREREEFINSVMKLFPSIFDNMILGGEDDEDKED
jgi:hypothetical protein